jgi:cell division septum initiation protein DivIVA
MTLHLLDLVDPRIDQYAMEIKALQTKMDELNQRESELQQREQILNSIDKSVWEKVEKKAAKKAKKQARAENDTQQQDDNVVNLAQAAGNTKEEVAVNTASLPGANQDNSSPLGTVLMIGAALLLCVTTAFFYRKKQG